MGSLAQHDAVFHRLLFDAELRAQLRAGDWSALGDVADAFMGIDMDELEKLAIAIRNGLVRGSLGGLGIGDAFPDTIAALGDEASAIVERFLAATGGAAIDGRATDGTGRRAGISMLEAFYGWAMQELEARPSSRCRAQHELAAALIKALTQTPRPGFVIGWPFVHPGPKGSACVLDAARALADPHDPPELPVVFVTVARRYATGRLSLPLAAVVLEQANDPPRWVHEQLATLDPSALDEVRHALAARGLS